MDAQTPTRARKFVIVSNRTGQIVFATFASDDIAACDYWAAHRSGYDTLVEMARSAIFRDLADVRAEAA
jgi:hypothetical protein